MADNKLFYGDNLDVLRRYIKDETVEIYIFAVEQKHRIGPKSSRVAAALKLARGASPG